ncbi:MAG: TolC family protein [Fibrobacter sp.]|nr:TolC family protein [Fibrobacter sp.]
MSNGFISIPVRRPVLITVIYLIVIIIGLFSLWRLPVDLMPEVTFPSITVTCEYANAGPQEVEELITRPIESALAGIQGIEEISSTSSEGRSRVRAMFVWGTNLEEATNDIRDRIDRILGRLPDGVERPQIRKFDLSAFPIINLGVESDFDLAETRKLIEDQIQYRLERVEGVASVDIRGGSRREIQVKLRATSLDGLRITPEMILNALRQENGNIPAGSIKQGSKEIIVRTFAEFQGVEDVRSTIVTVRDGVSLTVGDVAEVTEGLEERTNFVRINRKPGIQLSISKQSGVNTVSVAKEVHHEIERINQDFPQIRILPLMDTSKFIQSSIGAVGSSLILGGAIAIFILLLFLRNVSSTIIIGVVIPVSIIATFALVYFGGLTLNMMTFGGLALGIGMLVDNAIVVLDNIYHHREKGTRKAESAIKGTSEVASAVTASTLTTLVVFFPVVFIKGMSGIMFRQLAYVVSFALACSLIAALTLLPMLSSKFLHLPDTNHKKNGKRKWFSDFFEKSEKVYLKIENKYGQVIRWALHNRKKVLLGTLAAFVISILMLPLVGMELMPTADEGEVRVDLEMDVGTRLELMDSVTTIAEKILQESIPEAEYIVSNVGGGGWGSSSSHTSSIRVSLVEKKKRSRSSAQIANSLRGKLSGLTGVSVRVREGQGLFMLRVGQQGSAQEVEIEVRGRDLETGQKLAGQIVSEISDIKGINDTRISRQAGMPEYVLHIDRKRAADLGFTASQIGNAIQTTMGGTNATTVRQNGKEYTVLVRLAEEDRMHTDQLHNLSLVNKSGQSVPLQTVVISELSSGPVQIERRDRERILTVTANYSGRDLGSIVEDVRTKIRNISTPPEFAILIRGDYEEQQKAFRELMIGIIMAIGLVFLVMAAQFESFKDPFIVLFSIPVALIGVVAILYLSGTPLSVQAFIGCIILAGIVVNNAIVLIDYINRLRREENVELHEAIIRAGIRRLRPIMMTASTTTLGLLPLALGVGDGGEAQAPMARVVIGGLIASTLITLLLIPVIYSIVEEQIHRRRQKREKHDPASSKVPLAGAVSALIFFSVFSGSGTENSNAGSLSLQQALSLAMKSNPLVQIDRIDVDIAKTYVKENAYRFEPVINASLGRHFDSSDGSFKGTLGVSEYFPTGTTLSASTETGPSRNQRTVQLSFTQALLQNGGLKTNLAPVRKAAVDLEISQEELAGYAQQLMANVEKAYWDLYLSEKEVRIHQRSLELVERLLYETEEKLKAGKVAQLDLAIVKAEAASRKKNLIDARTAHIKKKLQLSYLISDSSVGWEDQVSLSDTPPPPDSTGNLEEILKAARNFRPDLRQANLLARKGELEIAQTRNGLLPKLDFFISLSGTAYAGSFREAMGSKSDYGIDAGLNLSLPITNGAQRQKYRRATLSSQRIDMSIANLNKLIELDIRSAWEESRRALQQIEAAKVARELQDQRVSAEQEKLAVGRSTEYMVLQAQRDQIEAQLDEARSEVVYANAITDLYLKGGTLLERRGVSSR